MIDRIGKFATVAGALASAAVFVSGPVAAQEASDILRPTSAWNLRYDTDKCRLVRQFGPDGDHLLMIDQSGPEPFYNLTLIGERTKNFYRGLASVRFGPNEKATERSFVTGKLDDKRPLVLMHGVTLAPVVEKPEGEVDAIGEAREAAIDRIVVTRNGRDPIELRTGTMGEAFAALRKCARDLETYLELKPEDGSTGPKPIGIETWLSSDDYPTRMLERGEEGLVSFRLTVDEDGAPTSCHISNSTRPQTFDDVVCLALIKRARFEPAADAEGNPRAAYYSGKVAFQI